MDLSGKFINYAQEQQLFTAANRILLAVSGGADSMVMLQLFIENKFNIAVAHCNFKLRADESDTDEQFVADYCRQKNIPCFVKHFDTKTYAKEHKRSTQEAARELRYGWFEELRKKENCDLIATAHHANDSAETVLINIIRGTGIRGLTGIKTKNNFIIRPLLFATRTEIEVYAKMNAIPFRTDSSNFKSDYLRNFIRNKLIPLVDEQTGTSLTHNLLQLAQHAKGVEQVFSATIHQVKNKICIEEGGVLKIETDSLLQFENPVLLLFEILYPYGFNQTQTEQIVAAIYEQSGKVFFSKEYKLVKDRAYLLLKKEEQNTGIVLVDEQTSFVTLPQFYLTFDVSKNSGESVFKPNEQLLDFDKLKFPLTLRHPLPGDTFTPLGMSNFKKLSDYFIDKKYSLIDKENALVLCSAEAIVCVVNERIDERVKITASTKKVFRIAVQRS